MNYNTSNNINQKNIIILNKTVNIDSIENISQYSKIITLDFESHISLLKKNIKHQISDIDIDDTIINKIQESSYHLSSWYENDKIKNNMKFEGIKIGELFFYELYQKLVSIFWTLINLKIIMEKNPNTIFFIPLNIESSVKLFTNSYQVMVDNLLSNNVNTEFEFVLNFSFLHIPLKLSIKKIHKIKTFLRLIFNLFLNKKPLHDKSILLLNFSTLRWKHILFALRDQFQFIKYDVVLPPVWNLDSFSIIQSSKTIVEDIPNSQIKTFKNNSNNVLHNLEIFFQENASFFNDFFKFENKSFWSILKPYFKQTLTDKTFETMKYYKFLHKLFNKYNFDFLFIYSELFLQEMISIHLAKKFNIPIILLQHGLYSFRIPTLHNFSRILGKYSDYLLVWGKNMVDYTNQNSQSDTKIVEIGSLYYDDWKIPSNQINDYVLIAPVPPSDDDVFTQFQLTKFKEQYIDTIKTICQNLSKYNKKIIIKLHHDQYCFEDYAIEDIDSDIKIIRGGDLKPLLEKCELLITVGVTTAILEAALMNKPAIFVPNALDNPIFDEFSQLRVYVENLGDFFQQFYKNENTSQILLAGKSFLNNNISNQGNSSKKLSDFLTNIKSNN
jgi:hypothetical protein